MLQNAKNNFTSITMSHISYTFDKSAQHYKRLFVNWLREKISTSFALGLNRFSFLLMMAKEKHGKNSQRQQTKSYYYYIVTIRFQFIKLNFSYSVFEQS